MIIPALRKIILLVISLLIIFQLAGQKSNSSDSLFRVLAVTKVDRAKVRLLLQISGAEELRDPMKALLYARQALKISQMANFDSAEVNAMIHMGVNLNRLSNLKEALSIGEQVVEKASQYNMNMEVAVGRGIMAVAYAQVGDFDNSSRLYFENLKLYEKLHDKRQQGRTLGNIGADFLEQQSYVKALEYTNKALMIGLETNNLTLVTDQYNNLAAIYQVGFRDYKTAMLNYFKALKVAEEIEDFQQQGGILLNIGRICMKTEQFDSAFFYLDKSYVILRKTDNPVLLADCYTSLGTYYLLRKDYAKGKQFALSSLKIGEENGMLQSIHDATELLHKISMQEKDTAKAYQYHILLTNAKDSLYLLQNQKELFRIEIQYNQEKVAKEQKIKQITTYFIFGFIILGLLSGLVIVFLFYSRQKIKIKNALLEKEKVESTLNFKSKELSINLLSLLKKNELIAEISHKLEALVHAPSLIDLKEAAIKLNLEIKQSSDDRLWQEFSMRFKETNSEFYDKLTEKYPDLTQSESKLCAYLRLNMSTKEISDLTGQRTETIEKARYRLRKKFGLNNSDSNLVAFLSQI
jgi:tetratricopeptide (TPR) repeat protein/DNA-binding CsgD family transcriptional regulator